MVRATRRGPIENDISKRVILGKLDGNLLQSRTNCQIASNKSILNTPKNNDQQSSSIIIKPLASNSKPLNCPVYKTVMSSPVKHNVRNADDKLHLYDFEVDENEPVAKKKKRKPILKMGSKKFRTYKKKDKCNTVLAPINLSNLENIYKNATPVNKAILKNSESRNLAMVSNKDSNTSNSSAAPISTTGNTSFCNEIDSSINSVVEASEPMLYSPQPYQSPKRDSLSVPVIRSSTSHNNENEHPKTLNSSASSSKCNATINSPFSAHFNTPVYLGSSTPIRSHWTEHTNAFANETDIEKFDVSNFFGFNDSVSLDEPFVSPIKKYTTPGKTPNKICRKPSPNKLSVKQVIRMLKYGPDAKDLSQEEDSQSNDVSTNKLPEDFFHTGDSPEYDYSPGHSPPTPISLKMEMKSKFDKKKKKKVVIVDPVADLEKTDDRSLKLDKTQNKDEVHHRKTRTRRGVKENSVLNEENPVCHQTRKKKALENLNPDLGNNLNLNVEKSTKKMNITENIDTVQNRTTRARSRLAKENNQTPTTLNKQNAVSHYSRKQKELDVINPEIQNEVDIFGDKNIKKPRRSYERPEYLRTKKYYMDLLSDSDDEPAFVPEETNTTVKEPQRKRNALSKKDEMELEKWAKAFNEQCMQVENFNLVVE